MQTAKFKLSLPQDRRCVSCDEFGPKVGSVRLMKRTLDEYGDEVWAPRDAEILNALLAAHYRCPIDLTGKIEGLHAVARALNKGDVTHACFVTIFLQFPDLPPFDDEAADRYDELLASLQWSGLLKADEEWNKKHPRTNEPPNRGWFAPVPKDPKAQVSVEDAGNRRWPPKKTNEIVREWAQKNPAPRVPSHASRLELIFLILDELSKMELNKGEDLITAQLYASYDPPETLDELRLRPEQYSAGYEQHHIVEQNDANRAKFGDAMIDDPDNIVWIPRLKHEKITAYYNSSPAKGEPPFRESISTLDFERQKQVGLDKLRQFGVLK
jgi:hypothetical protein